LHGQSTRLGRVDETALPGEPWQASDVEHQLSALIVPVPEAEPMIGR
jgi:hypothetical protein